MNLIASMSGKVCSHGDTYFVTNRQTGKVHTAKMCYPNPQDPTPAQESQRLKFKKRAQDTSKWIKQNGPSTENPHGTELFVRAQSAYKAQHKIGSFFGFISSKMAEDGTINLGEASSTGNSSENGGNQGGGDIG